MATVMRERNQHGRVRNLILMGALLSVIPGDWVARSVTACLAEANTKRCACPLAPGESVFIPCFSVNNPDSCGACSVLSPDGTRSGRTCIAIQ